MRSKFSAENSGNDTFKLHSNPGNDHISLSKAAFVPVFTTSTIVHLFLNYIYKYTNSSKNIKELDSERKNRNKNALKENSYFTYANLEARGSIYRIQVAFISLHTYFILSLNPYN